MNILILSQVFWPDTASTSQHLTDLAEDLIVKGHTVEVFSSRRNYENPGERYKKKEIYKGINISRIWNTGFGKGRIIGRILDFMTFNIALFSKLLMLKKNRINLIIGMTSPPLISFFGVIIGYLKEAKFLYWVMDVQPDLSITAGYIKNGSTFARLLLRVGDFIYKKADGVITLDRFMKDHVITRGAETGRVFVIPVWPVLKDFYSGDRLENPFRMENGFGDKIVVMYSGNHSVVHPLDTLLNMVLNLKEDNRFLFVFIGGGVRKKDVTDFKVKHNLDNIIQLKYQERDKIHISLGAADIHVVIQGSNCVGLTHPNKIYGAMSVARPVLNIGPSPSHISDVLENCRGNISIAHGEVEKLVGELQNFTDMKEEDRRKVGIENMLFVQKKFTREKLVGEIIGVIENLI